MTASDHSAAARPYWEAACASLAEAGAIDPERAPAAVVHASYYAMFHAARAVLVLHDGLDAAKTHRGVIARFARLLGEDPPGREQARAR